LGVSKFCRVINANFAESLQPLINISFPKIVGEQAAEAGLPIVLRSIFTKFVRKYFILFFLSKSMFFPLGFNILPLTCWPGGVISHTLL
jgi:hypothetical protein